jgi:hypothetical protein
MYSYEARIRAVKLYIMLGKCLMATIRQWGYQELPHWLVPGVRAEREPASRVFAIRTEVFRSAEACGGEALP